jgi:hypothetical protein
MGARFLVLQGIFLNKAVFRADNRVFGGNLSSGAGGGYAPAKVFLSVRGCFWCSEGSIRGIEGYFRLLEHRQFEDLRILWFLTPDEIFV